ncbi:MAG: 4Fe-4S binding protein, partial [Draconibacterium sp.]|nr:4Fe-4S binding protein [Draconibacterium sp.]
MKPGHVRFISTLLAIIFALPFSFDWVIGLYNWLSPFILLNSLFLLKSLVVLNILGFVILILSFFRNRWFCRYLCPVGLGCDTVSTLSPRKRVFLKSIQSLSRWFYLIYLVEAWLGNPLFIL